VLRELQGSTRTQAPRAVKRAALEIIRRCANDIAELRRIVTKGRSASPRL
jgi:hypothetical protein